MRIAVIFPGIGYNKDMPLLYYSRKMVEPYCEKIVCVDYHDLPTDVKGDEQKMWKAANLAYAQAAEQLKDIDFSEYSDIVFIGKSMGTVIAAEYATEHSLNAMQIWLTPVEATFSCARVYPDLFRNTIAFIGGADTWSDVAKIQQLAEELHIWLKVIPDCNHSLEHKWFTMDKELDVLRSVMATMDGRLSFYLTRDVF